MTKRKLSPTRFTGAAERRRAFVSTSGALAFALTAATLPARAQSSMRVALEAKLQLTSLGGLTVVANAGNPPVTYAQFYGGGTLLSDSGYTNNVSGGGITTGVITDLYAPNNGVGGGESGATYNLLFNPSVTLNNTTSNSIQYSFTYDISYGAYVNVTLNGGTGSATENASIFLTNTTTGTISNFTPQPLSSTSGMFSSDSSQVPGQLSGTASVPANSSRTLAFITRVEGSAQYTPPSAVAALEPGTVTFLIFSSLPAVPIIACRRRESA